MPLSISSSRARGRLARLPVILAVVFCAFVLAESGIWNNAWWLTFLARYAGYDSDMDPAWVTASVRLLPRDNPDPPIVLLGSSQVREGLDAGSLEASLGGRRCLNLGLSGGSPTDMLAVLADLDARAPRRSLVIGLSPQMFDREPKSPFVRFRDMPMIARTCPWGDGKAPDMARMLVAASFCNLSPTLRHKDSIVELIDNLEGRLPEALAFRLPPFERFKSMNEHFLSEEAFMRRVVELKADEIGEEREWMGVQGAAFLRLLRAESGRGNPVLLFDFPMRLGSDGIFHGPLESFYWDFLKEGDGIPGVAVAEPGAFAGLDVRFFADVSHMNASGRRAMTLRLSELLNRQGL